jgi:hypothetical protein
MAAVHNMLAGSSGRIRATITLSANQTNYVFSSTKVDGYVAGQMDVTLVINSGVYVSSNDTFRPALEVTKGWHFGDSLTIVNNGFIVGMGGAGGGGSGSPGGLAFGTLREVRVNNAGTIAGGGGGGGRGASLGYGSGKDYYVAAGGGGGGGRSSAAANSSGGAGFVNGSQGTRFAPGVGGAGQSGWAGGGGTGGAGGAWGAAGNVGGLGGWPAGSGGAAVYGNSSITWVATGTRLGAIT